ncbi:MAG: XdhC family protein [Proteobacteria bacterium]|nr:XdhC family protein [Pseudomonadota bacterium]MBU1583851.1 XdhC family protein [Pseudomonadota bacterium]MBU2630179.1 XdhC family protein [Pseudomonadota bacterium]
MESLTQPILDCLKQGIPFALATIIAHKGSTPRTSGSKMVVLSDRSLFGTIGGGLVEARVMDACIDMMSVPQCRIIEFTLDQKLKDGLDMVCGGNLTVWIETFGSHPSPSLIQIFATMAAQEKAGKKAVVISKINGFSGASFTTEKCLVLPDGTIIGTNMIPKVLFDAVCSNQFSGAAPMIQNYGLEEFIVEPSQTCDTLYIFGAGHVGFQLAKMAHLTEFRTIVVDDREEFANQKRFKHAQTVLVVDKFANAFDTLSIDKNAYIVILTRGHLHDQTVLEAALKTEAPYIGMIGSSRKRNQIYANLTKKGVSKASLDQVYSPIGLDINSETPAEIAVSIIGQIIQVRAQMR